MHDSSLMSEQTAEPRPLFAQERQDAIARALREQGRVEVAELAERFRVSEDSIRRDLRLLAARGLVQKTHGGAVALHAGALPMGERAALNTAPKRAIALAALAHVLPNQTLFIDSGSTALALAQLLAAPGAPRPLTVITPSLDAALPLCRDATLRLVLAGGEWSHETRAFAGAQAEATLRAYCADWAFLGACALHPRLGMTASQPGDAALKRAMLESSCARVLLADASKFDQVQPYPVAPLAQLDRVISDAAPPWLREAVAQVECVDTP